MRDWGMGPPGLVLTVHTCAYRACHFPILTFIYLTIHKEYRYTRYAHHAETRMVDGFLREHLLKKGLYKVFTRYARAVVFYDPSSAFT